MVLSVISTSSAIEASHAPRTTADVSLAPSVLIAQPAGVVTAPANADGRRNATRTKIDAFLATVS